MKPPTPPKPRGTRTGWRGILSRRWVRFVLLVGVLLSGVGLLHGWLKPLPRGVGTAGVVRAVSAADVEFLHDVTWQEEGRRVARQQLFDRVFRLIGEAEELVVLDLFLFNDFLGSGGEAPHRALSRELTDALVARRRAVPGLKVVLISDPVNEAYGGSPSPYYAALREAGVTVVVTRLEGLRDSNVAWSAPWRVCLQWFGTSPGGWMPHPFSKESPGVGVRSWFALLNFKANHRKVVVADAPARGGGRELVGLVMSANPHDGSSAHGNVGLVVRGMPAWDLLDSEQDVLDLSGNRVVLRDHVTRASAEAANAGVSGPALEVQRLSEGAIRAAIVTELGKAGPGDSVDLAMFYLSDRPVLEALAGAAGRGAKLRLMLDPNRDAFGHLKSGVPNRPVASELMRRCGTNLMVRWYDTHGEQFHTKVLLVRRGGQTTLIAGSANLTRRNIGNYNLETNLRVSGAESAPALAAATDYFERLWTNRDHGYTRGHEAYADGSWRKAWRYRLQEATGMGAF